MATFLFDDIVFGPIKSRRLGISLGINLLPIDSKYCNFNCIYCECGWNTKGEKKMLPKKEIFQAFTTKFNKLANEGVVPDVITFAGNGEPTMHPDFEEIIDFTIDLRNTIFPEASIAVLSNATLIHKKNIFNSLLKVDRNILKIDSAIEESYNKINIPSPGYSFKRTIETLKQFNGNFIMQTMFLKGEYNNSIIDNTTETEINAWIEVIKKTNPSEVMIYSLDRDTPASNLQAIDKNSLEVIAEKVRKEGFTISVS